MLLREPPPGPQEGSQGTTNPRHGPYLSPAEPHARAAKGLDVHLPKAPSVLGNALLKRL